MRYSIAILLSIALMGCAANLTDTGPAAAATGQQDLVRLRLDQMERERELRQRMYYQQQAARELEQIERNLATR